MNKLFSRHVFFGTLLFPALLLLLITSCKKEGGHETAENQAASSPDALATQTGSRTDGSAMTAMTQAGLLKVVHSTTARFHSTTQAIKAGYIPSNQCVSRPNMGGMGYHWVNPSLVDAVFNPLQPEVMLYARGPEGDLRLVAVEYIVINTGQARPSFGDRLFDIGGTPTPGPHWSLHVWVHENNPAGTFTPFNPNITCP